MFYLMQHFRELLLLLDFRDSEKTQRSKCFVCFNVWIRP